MKPEFSQPIF